MVRYGGPLIPDDLQEWAWRQAALQQAEEGPEALHFEISAARGFGRVTADLRQFGSIAKGGRTTRRSP